ncbi:hypothetical protein HLB30_06755 [Peptostreptococcus russellii]|nr:CD1871A family CXXC motif-containing protein [Peptostreptococcus russellii]MBC2578222.1 hypothetical protein [Peptostreptococcus russellii]
MKKRNLRIAVFLISIIFIGVGIAREEDVEVLEKGVKICLECIGIE